MKDRLTKYECSRILGVRASQIAMHAPLLVNVPPEKKGQFLYIAALELKHGLLDLMVCRPLPFDKFYEVHISKLELSDDLDALIAMYEQ